MDDTAWLLEVVEAMPDGVVIVAGDGEILLVNREMEHITGYSRAEMLGQTVDMFLPAAQRAAHAGHRRGFAAAPRRRAMGTGMTLSARRADGSEFPVEISLAPPTSATSTSSSHRYATSRPAAPPTQNSSRLASA